MSLLTLQGAPVLSARVTLPRQGAWVADVVVDTADALSGPVELRTFDGSFALSGVIERGGVERDTFHARLIGGAGGLEKEIAAQSYRFVPARTVLGDVLAAAGERLSAASDPRVLATSLPYWTRERGPCSAVLTRVTTVLETTWRVLPDGSVWVGRETWPEAPTLPFEVLEDTPHDDRLLLGVEAPALLPGTTLRGRRVGLVVHTMDEVTRTEVWFERPDRERSRLFEGLQRWLAKALLRMDTLALYPARVVSQNDDGSLELKPDSDRLPGLSKVPIRAGLPGVQVKVASGARVLLAFEEGDPRRPIATLWEEPKLLELHVGGDRGVARVADTVVVPVPQGYEFTATIELGVPAAIGLKLYPFSKVTLLPTAPKALIGTIVTGSEKLRA